MDFGAFRFLGLSEQGLGSAKEERTLSIVTIGITIPFGKHKPSLSHLFLTKNHYIKNYIMNLLKDY